MCSTVVETACFGIFFAFCVESENVLVDRSLMDEESDSTHEYDDVSASDTSED